MKWTALFLVLGGCENCERYRYTGGVSLPREGTEIPASVPMNLAWEHVLEIDSGGTWGPVPPSDVRASTDGAACRAVVMPNVKDGDDMRLVVIGLRTGRCAVDLAYADPHAKRWKAKIQIDFTPPETLPVLAVGALHPAGPMMFDGAHCEAERATVRCFPKDSYGADERHASCKHSSRCGSSRGGPQGFELCTTTSGGIVTGITAWESLPRDEVRIRTIEGDGGCALKNVVP